MSDEEEKKILRIPEDIDKIPDANFKLMEKINKLAETGKKEDVLESLDIFEKKWKELPGTSADEYLKRMLHHADKDIVEKAKEVEKKTIGPIKIQLALASSAFSLGSIPVLQSLSQQMQSLNSARATMEAIFRESETIKSLRMMAQYTSEFQKAFSFANIRLPEIDTTLLPESRLLTLNKAIEEDTDIQDLRKQYFDPNQDIVLNFKGFEALTWLEMRIRQVIKKYIIGPDPKQFHSKLPDMWKNWVDKQKKEIDEPFITESTELLDYADFTDYKTILETGRNIKLLSGIVNEQQFWSVISKLSEIEPIRLKIAHSRALTWDEFNRLKMYVEDFESLFGDLE